MYFILVIINLVTTLITPEKNLYLNLQNLDFFFTTDTMT